jgi:hypothetical protein
VKRSKFDLDARRLYYRAAMSGSVLIVDDDDMTTALVAEVLSSLASPHLAST